MRQLIQADSTPAHGESVAAEVIAARFRQHDIACAVNRWDGNRANVTAHVKSAGKKPALLFVCHLDVVDPGQEAWEHPPFGAAQEDGRICGRGATDMKGGIASVVTAICEVVDSGVALEGDIILAATAGEETDSAGVERFMQDRAWLPPLAGVVIPEPTDFAVVTAHRGLFWLKIATGGKAVHSSMPERGVNAISSMKHVLDELDRYQIPFEPHPRLGKCSLSMNTIHGGAAMNMVPDKCTLGVDIRTLPAQDHEAIRSDVERILARLRTAAPPFEAELAVERSVPAMETDLACPFVKAFCSAVGVDLTNVVGYTTDAPHLVPLGAPIVIYGPGKPKMCHQVDEYIDVTDLEKGADFFTRIIRTFLT